MKGYFLDLVRLAHGAGPRLQPRPAAAFEGEWTEAEGEVEANGHEPRPPAPPLTPSIATPSIGASTTNVFETSSVANEFHAYPPAETAPTVVRNGENRLVETTVHEAAFQSTEIYAPEVRTSLRELVREARTMRESATRETVRAEREQTLHTTTREVERKTEVERLVREVRESALERETTRETLTKIDREGPDVEIHIGRIEVRPPAPAASKEASHEKPKGVIDLNDYLRARSRGTS